MAEAKSARAGAVERPLSPHLQIYRLINMVMSIVHRITGAAMYFGSLLLAWWLIAAATGPEFFTCVTDCSPPGLARSFCWATLGR